MSLSEVERFDEGGTNISIESLFASDFVTPIGHITVNDATFTIPTGYENGLMFSAEVVFSNYNDGDQSTFTILKNGVKCASKLSTDTDQYERNIGHPVMFFAKTGDVIKAHHTGSGRFGYMYIFG